MKIPLLAAACLGLVTGCASLAPRTVPASLAIDTADTRDPLDRAKGFTHLAFVIDTSGSMRDPRTTKLWPMVAYSVANVLATHPETQWIQWIDTSGRPMGGRDEWLPCNRSTTDRLLFLLDQYTEPFGVSSPTQGLLKALTLPLPQGLHDKIHICVIGDESIGQTEPALRAIEQANPPDGYGGWRATISAVQLPTTALASGGMGKTGLQFEALMNALATRNGGTFRMLASVDHP